MSREIEEMRDILDGSSASEQENDDDQEGDTPSSHFSQSSRGLFIFSPTADSTALHSLYPSPSDLLTMFDVFQQNVDPVARIFHCPTLRTTVTEALPLLDGPLDRHTGLVLFSISYAALTSLDDDECQRMFGEERRVMLPRYRYAVEQSLVRARFLDSQNLTVLTSLVLFLLCVRRHDSSRFVSSLLGVVIRNAQAMGLHRDGTNFQLSPYETEMRRRVWWHICVLDLRASEDHGCDPSIYDQNYDTKFPLSINDEDISPSDTVPPPEHVAGSDMIFCLLRFEVAVAIRRLNYPAPVGSHKSELSVGQKRRMVETVEKHFYERYIHRCDITKSFDWVSATWAKLMLAKMWLAVSNPLQPHSNSDDTATTPTSTPVNMRSLAFENAIEYWGGYNTHYKIVLSPCNGGRLLSYYCFFPREASDLAHQSWDQAATVEELLAPYPDLDRQVFKHLEISYKMMPDQSQGACQAIEDAAALGLVFGKDNFNGNIRKALEVFEEVRKPRGTRVQAASARARENINERIGFSSNTNTTVYAVQSEEEKLTIDEMNLSSAMYLPYMIDD
ncbi:hypothetical protein CEP53_007054 [Fusarium sp. AF-6]|nr:hypothetical protein CEP53_007054 [Fusarium sp. AF-6]